MSPSFHVPQSKADADPRRGRNPGYSEDQPRDHEDANSAGKPSQPTPDVPQDPTGRPDDPA